jgi:hypothetical protein
VENISAYVRMGPPPAMAEWEFVRAVVERAGCRLLLDVNNVWVNAANHGFDPQRYLEGIDPASVGEIHLGGFERTPQLLVDTHGAPVAEDVWSLYSSALARFGRRPTLVEWDTDIPPIDVLLAQAERARAAAA